MYQNNRFYEIKSQKSNEFINGVRQISLSSEIFDNIQCFLWVNGDGALQHLQLLYDEKILEWFADRGFVNGATNRLLNPVEKIGLQKGVRTIHERSDDENLKQGIFLLENSFFPPPYHQLVSILFL